MFTLGRKIDIHYPTNRWIVIITIIVTGVSYFLTREFSIAWKVGASIFLTWAITREIDPKREYAAFVSCFLALSSFLVAFKIDLMIVFFLLLALRFVNKITGDKNTILDMLTLLGFAGWLSYSGKTSVYLLILLVGLYLNMNNTKDKKMNTVFFILTTVGLFAQLFMLEGFRLSASASLFMDKGIMIISSISILVFIVYILIDQDKSIPDDNGQMIEAKKILSGQIFFAIGVSLLFVFTKVSVGNIIVYLASIWGYMIYGTISMLKNKKIQD